MKNIIYLKYLIHEEIIKRYDVKKIVYIEGTSKFYYLGDSILDIYESNDDVLFKHFTKLYEARKYDLSNYPVLNDSNWDIIYYYPLSHPESSKHSIKFYQFKLSHLSNMELEKERSSILTQLAIIDNDIKENKKYKFDGLFEKILIELYKQLHDKSVLIKDERMKRENQITFKGKFFHYKNEPDFSYETSNQDIMDQIREQNMQNRLKKYQSFF